MTENEKIFEEEQIELFCASIVDKIECYCFDFKIAISSFEKNCGIGNGTIGRWKSGKAVPNIKTLIRIQNTTGVSLKYWLEDVL